MCKIIGIDISKQTFDVGFNDGSSWNHLVLDNNEKGFKRLLKELSNNDWVVMEASGPYYLKLATFFYGKGYNVCVLNPLIIKRYSQTRLIRAKTDKKDAQTIAEYGAQYRLKQWKPEPTNISKIKQLYTFLELLNKEVHQSERQLEALTATGIMDKDLKSILKGIVSYLTCKRNKVEK